MFRRERWQQKEEVGLPLLWINRNPEKVREQPLAEGLAGHVSATGLDHFGGQRKQPSAGTGTAVKT
jgi:hypothetical protein